MFSSHKLAARQSLLSKIAHATEFVAGGGALAIGSYWAFEAVANHAPIPTVATDFVIAIAGLGLGYAAVRPARRGVKPEGPQPR